MDESVREETFQTSDGVPHRVRVTRCHPTTGQFVPGVRFLSFEDLEGRRLGIAGVNPAVAGIDFTPAQLEQLLRMAHRCHPAHRVA